MNSIIMGLDDELIVEKEGKAKMHIVSIGKELAEYAIRREKEAIEKLNQNLKDRAE